MGKGTHFFLVVFGDLSTLNPKGPGHPVTPMAVFCWIPRSRSAPSIRPPGSFCGRKAWRLREENFIYIFIYIYISSQPSKKMNSHESNNHHLVFSGILYVSSFLLRVTRAREWTGIWDGNGLYFLIMCMGSYIAIEWCYWNTSGNAIRWTAHTLGCVPRPSKYVLWKND